MVLSDLKTGMTVETKNGKLWRVLKAVETKYYGYQSIFFADLDIGFLIGTEYTEDLCHKKDSSLDIIKIYDIECDSMLLTKKIGEIIWTRKNVIYNHGYLALFHRDKQLSYKGYQPKRIQYSCRNNMPLDIKSYDEKNIEFAEADESFINKIDVWILDNEFNKIKIINSIYMKKGESIFIKTNTNYKVE